MCLFSLTPSELEAAWHSFGTLLKASIEALFTMLPTEPTKLLVLGILSKLALFCFTLVKPDGEVPTRKNELLDGYCSCWACERDCCVLGDNVPELDEAVAMAAAAAVKLGFLLDKCTGLVCMCNCCSKCLALLLLLLLFMKRFNDCRC